MHIDRRALPIVFIHIDDSEYLKYTLAQAKLSNPNASIYLIGDEYNDNYAFVTHVNIKQYSSEAELFSKIYKHHSPNSYDGELFCFKRWFILKEFMEHNNIKQCLYLDSDVLLFSDVLQEQKKYSDCVFTLSHEYGLGFNIFNDFGTLNEFCEFMVKCFVSQSLHNRLLAIAEAYGPVNDMLIFHEFKSKKPYKFGDVSLILDQTRHDANINLSEGFEMEGGVKKIIWRDGLPYCRETSSNSLIRFNSLHFQGRSKYMIKDYFRGELSYSESINKWIIKGMTATTNHYSHFLSTCKTDIEKSTHEACPQLSEGAHLNSKSIYNSAKQISDNMENAGILSASSNMQGTFETIEESIEKHPLSPDLLTLYGELKWQSNETDDAKKILLYVSGRWPDYYKAGKLLESLSSSDVKWDYAERLMESTLQLHPTSGLELINLINTSFALLMPEDLEIIIPLILRTSEFIEQDNLEDARRILNDILFELAYHQIREPKRKGYPPALSISNDKIIQNLLELGFEINDFEIDIEDYRKYFRLAQYTENFPDYHQYNITEKSLEHYISSRLLDLSDKDVFIDITNESSPAPIIYRNLFGAETSRQVFNRDQIEDDITNIPLADESATKMALFCSFEHFEGDSDITFIKEITRVLKPGGSVCIVPLYLSQEYSIVTDPVVAVSQNVGFENKSVVCCVKGLKSRFSRFYDPVSLKNRIQNNLGDLTLRIFRITNANFDSSCYAQFAGLLTKPYPGNITPNNHPFQIQ